jgi:hypothetical protein
MLFFSLTLFSGFLAYASLELLFNNRYLAPSGPVLSSTIILSISKLTVLNLKPLSFIFLIIVALRPGNVKHKGTKGIYPGLIVSPACTNLVKLGFLTLVITVPLENFALIFAMLGG